MISRYLLGLVACDNGPASSLTLPELQTDNYNLPIGGVFQYGDELRITVANVPYLRGSTATGAVGGVTVTTT